MTGVQELLVVVLSILLFILTLPVRLAAWIWRAIR